MKYCCRGSPAPLRQAQTYADNIANNSRCQWLGESYGERLMGRPWSFICGGVAAKTFRHERTIDSDKAFGIEAEGKFPPASSNKHWPDEPATLVQP